MSLLSVVRRFVSKPPATGQEPANAASRGLTVTNVSSGSRVLGSASTTEAPAVMQNQSTSARAFQVYLGQEVNSPNGKWTVVYQDPGPGGFQDQRSAERWNRVQLRENATGTICATVSNLVRPFAADVSDVGVFAVNDAGSRAELSSELVVFDLAGRELYRRSYRANLFSFKISACGRYVVSMTCNSGNNDGNVLEAHDVRERKVLFSRNPVTQWTTEYVLETVGEKLAKVQVKIRDLGYFAYSSTGEFLDVNAYREARLTKGDYVARTRAAEEMLAEDRSEDNSPRRSVAWRWCSGRPETIRSARLQDTGFEVNCLRHWAVASKLPRPIMQRCNSTPRSGSRRSLTPLRYQRSRQDPPSN